MAEKRDKPETSTNDIEEPQFKRPKTTQDDTSAILETVNSQEGDARWSASQ